MPSGTPGLHTKEERNFARKANRYDGAEWRRRLDLIDNQEAKLAAAIIIWWDYFAGRTMNDRWNDLDDLRSEYNKVFRNGRVPSLKKLEEGLLIVGYPPSKAETRSKYKRGKEVGSEKWQREQSTT